MAESTRRHDRLIPRALQGDTMRISWGAANAADLYLPRDRSTALDLVVHFHGAPWLVHQAVATRKQTASLVLNLGSGSGVYDRTFATADAFEHLLNSAAQGAARQRGTPVQWRRITLSGFSAGHGAIRRILRTPAQAERIAAVLLLDGMHTSYIPEGTPLASGSVLDTTNLVALAQFARRAAQGNTRMMVTHSEIFPGTYASTTETADWVLRDLAVPRRAVLEWGPRGMQQLSDARRGQLQVRGYAGNSAPDHVDHLHAMPELLRELWR
jgi:hypothetical protein